MEQTIHAGGAAVCFHVPQHTYTGSGCRKTTRPSSPTRYESERNLKGRDEI